MTYVIRYPGQPGFIAMMFGLLVGGGKPDQFDDPAVEWNATGWYCNGIRITDWQGASRDGRRWRHIYIPVEGFAAYKGVPSKAAARLDRILDSMCCGKCGPCRDSKPQEPASRR